MRKLAIIAFALNPILWASFYTVAKPRIAESSPLLFSTIELLWTVPVALIILATISYRRITLRNIMRGILAGSSLYAVVLLSAGALSLTTATETAFFPALNGLLAVLFAWVILRRRADRATWLGGLVAAAGVIFALPALGDRFLGNMIALAAAVAYTAYIYVAEWATKDDDADVWTIFAAELLTMAFYGSALMIATGKGPELFRQSTSLYWMASYVGIVTTVIPTAISIMFQRYVSPITTAFLYTFEPVWSAILAAGFLGEELDLRSYFGGLCILVGAAIHSFRQTHVTARS